VAKRRKGRNGATGHVAGATAPKELAGISIRVSLDKRAHGMAEEIVSPDTQEDRCRAYCEAQGWEVVMVESDLDESGFNQHYTKREGLMRLIRAVEEGKITKIVVFKFNRLSRRLADFTEICDRVERAGGGIVSVTEQVDTSTPAGRMIRNIMASFAQYQSEELAEQIYETWLTKVKRGERQPGRPPYGTRLVKGMLVPDPETHHHLLHIFDLFLATHSVAAVTDDLNSSGVPTPTGAPRWTNFTVRRILTNPAYVARNWFDGQEYPGNWEPIVPVDTWEQVQAVFAGRRTGPQIDRVDSHLLRGRIICGECGRPMATIYSKRWVDKRLSRDRFYFCHDYTTGRVACKMPYVHGEEVEKAVWDLVLALTRDERLELLERAITEPDDPDPVERRRQELIHARERTQRQIHQLFELLADGAITKAQFVEQNRLYSERLAQIQGELESLTVPLRAKPTPEMIRRVAREAPEASTLLDRRRILEDLDVKVEVHWHAVYAYVLGLKFRLRARLMGHRWYFGEDYQRLDYQGTMLTDKQIKFIQRTYYRGYDKHKIAARLGRSYDALKRIAARLRRAGRLMPPSRPYRARAVTTDSQSAC